MTHREPTALASLDDITAFWRARMDPLDFCERALWMTTIHADAPSDVLIEVGDLPAAPTQEDVGGLAALLAHITAEQPCTRIAMLITRPGGGGPSDRDRTWVAALIEAARQADVVCGPVHLATDHALDVIPPEACDPGVIRAR